MLNISVAVKKFALPVIFIVVGVLLVMVGFKSNQPTEFKIAAFAILVGSIASVLNSTGILSNMVSKIIGFTSMIISVVLLVFSFSSVEDTVKYQNDYKMCKEIAKRNLSDLRTAQKAYFENNGKYAADWETIIDYINNGTTKIVEAEGEKPSRRITEAERNYIYKDSRAIDNNMTDMEAYILSKSPICPDDLKNFKRDTIAVSFLKTTFTENRSYMKERMENGFGKFSAEELQYIPFTKKSKKWKIKVGETSMGDEKVPTLRVEGVIPFTKIKGEKKKETMYFGKLEMNDLSGSWEEE
ncbi:MAG: hypothetical protein RL264_1556 [Bacteroidota bacterium]|jgi:hypothetical protein